MPLATTNYDHLLAAVTGRPVATWLEEGKVFRIVRGETPGILHLHGHWEQPKSVVLGIRSYEKIRENEHAQSVIRAEAMTRSLLFVGCGEGLSDPNFQPFFQWLGKVNTKNDAFNYRLARNDEVEKLQAAHSKEQRIRVLGYGSDHADLPGFLRALAPAAPVVVTTTAGVRRRRTGGIGGPGRDDRR